MVRDNAMSDTESKNSGSVDSLTDILNNLNSDDEATDVNNGGSPLPIFVDKTNSEFPTSNEPNELIQRSNNALPGLENEERKLNRKQSLQGDYDEYHVIKQFIYSCNDDVGDK